MTKARKQRIKDMIRQAEQAYAWPGGYPVFAVMDDGGCLCPACVKQERRIIYTNSLYGNRTGWEIAGVDVNWEDAWLHCYHCGERIVSAYAEDDHTCDVASAYAEYEREEV
jgi:hypothetical protein